MSERTKVTAAPTTMKLGKRTFQMSPLKDEDIGIMDQWIRARHVRIARETLPEDASEEQKDRTERIALAQASIMSFMSGAGLLLMEHPDAAAMLFWCGIRHNHSDVTVEAIRELLVDPKNFNALQSEWNRINNDAKQSVRSDEKKKKNKRKAVKKSRRRNR